MSDDDAFSDRYRVQELLVCFGSTGHSVKSDKNLSAGTSMKNTMNARKSKNDVLKKTTKMRVET